jgi:hypothetical protein
MKTFVLYITTISVVLGLAGSLPAATVILKIEPTSSPTIPPGGSVSYRVLCRISSNDNYGLATVGLDLETDTGVTQGAATAGSAMAPFVSPDGLTNTAGFGGEAVGDDIRGIGGAQNTIDNDGVSPNPTAPSGDVIANIGLPGWVEVATGTITAPSQASTYTVNLANAFAGVLTASTGPIWPVSEATVVVALGSFEITVSSTAPRVFAGLDRDVFEGMDVALHAAAASPQNQPLQNPLFAWGQLTGLAVTLTGDDTADATFTAPTVDYIEDAGLSFSVAARDGTGPQSSDTVNVRVYIGGDCTLDDNVDVTDLLTLVDAFGTALGDPAYNPLCDFNADEAVDVIDLLAQVYNFGRSLTSSQSRSLMMQQSGMRAIAGSPSGSGFASEGGSGLGNMNVYEALEYAGLLDVYLDYIAEHPEAAK